MGTTDRRANPPEKKLLAEWFWTDRWMGSSAFGLPLEARGLYREMLTQGWRRGAQLPNDHETIRRLVGASEKEWKRSWPLIAKYWRVERDILVNDTQLEVYSAARGAAEKASDRGRKGGAASGQARSGPTQVEHKPNMSSTQVEHKGELAANPPSPSLISSVPSEQKNARVERNFKVVDPKEPPVAVFIQETYPQLYAKARNGAHYRVNEARDFEVCQQLVDTYGERLPKMLEYFLNMAGRDVLNQPGTPRQFAFLAPQVDSELRKCGL